MAVTLQDQIDALKAAIGQGAQVVRYADGRSVTYRSVDELQKALGALETELDEQTATARTARLLLITDPGL